MIQLPESVNGDDAKLGNDALSLSPVPPVPMRYSEFDIWRDIKNIFCVNVLLVVLLLGGLLSTFFTKGEARDEPSPGAIVCFALLGFVILGYWIAMFGALQEIGGALSAPKLRGEAKLREYVEDMQRAKLRVRFKVECHHMHSPKRKVSGPANTGKPRKKVTHCSYHPFKYATICTDKSTLLKNWQEPAGGEEGTLLETDSVAVVTTKVIWKATKGATTDALKAEKKRLYEEHKDRDKVCTVTTSCSFIPKHLKVQLYTPGDASIRRLPLVVELILVLLWLGAPLCFYYNYRLKRRIRHTVHKTFYIDEAA